MMNSDLLQDLAQYKRARDKPVATAARALISLFRELAPKMLEKKDRGRGADLDRDVDAYGSEKVLDRIEGAELLQREESRLRKEERAAEKAAAAAAAALESDDEAESGGEDDSAVEEAADSSDDDDDEEGEEVAEEEDGEGVGDDEEEEEEEEEEESASEDDDDDVEESDDDDDDDDDDDRVVDAKTGVKRKRLAPSMTMDQRRELAANAVKEAEAAGAPLPKVRKNGVLSLSELRRRHKEATRLRREREETEENGDDGDGDSDASDSDADAAAIERTRVLTPDDFKRIKALRTASQLSGAMQKGGGKKADATANDELRALMRRADAERFGSSTADRRVNPEALAAIGLRKAHDKASRVASIMAGREERGEFGSSQERKNKKTGGKSNKEKAKKKNLPLAARVRAAHKRRTGGVAKRVKDKQQRGHFRKGKF